MTLAESRFEFARVFVEIDLNYDFPTSFEIYNDDDRTMSIGVEYAWKPIKCSFCVVFGHTISTCGNKPKEVHVPKQIA